MGHKHLAPILVTGSEGLIGRHLCRKLEAAGFAIRKFDIRRSQLEDTTSSNALSDAIAEAQGIVHLAAVSRVVWAERDPELCQKTNVSAFRSILDIASRRSGTWVIFASSREVYGEQHNFPVPEQAILQPLNVYARSKYDGEMLAKNAQESGLLVNVCRFSNVYGCVKDHSDRVVPAFARAAATGSTIVVEGRDHFFDFVHIDDAANGLLRLVELTMQSSESQSPVHFASGVGTTLQLLADIATKHAKRPPTILHGQPRTFDVRGFVGSTERANALLGWKSNISIEDGMRRLINEFASMENPNSHLQL